MEDLLQYMWRYRLWSDRELTAGDGQRIEVIDQGKLNRGSGPDFFNAVIRVGEEVWAGTVEIHVRASDWHRHGHDGDPAYDNVVLHVVAYDDCPITRSDGVVIPQITLHSVRSLEESYRRFMSSPLSELPCARHLAEIPGLILNDWLTSLAFERLHRKADDVLGIVETTHGDWDTATYIILARAMGFGTNADAMERVARATPLRQIRRHADSVTSVEAMLLGRAGLLCDPPRDEYEARLLRDFRFYRHKFGTAEDLTPPPVANEPGAPYTPPVWNLRQRPANSPLRRLVALASFVRLHGTPFHSLSALEDYDQARNLFDYEVPVYWRTHSVFGHECPGPAAALGAGSINLLCINAVAPVQFAYAEYTGDDIRRDRVIEFMTSLRPERNSVITLFESAGISVPDAFTSQALIQLRRAYCEPRKCLYCRLGHRILSSPAVRDTCRVSPT